MPAWYRSTNRSIRPKICPIRRCTRNISTELKSPMACQLPICPRTERSTAAKVNNGEGGTGWFTHQETPRHPAEHKKKRQPIKIIPLRPAVASQYNTV